MMRTVEATGKSIDEAIFNGLKELEISIDEVDIEIVQTETKGILGIGAKPAIVRLTEREMEEIEVPEYMARAAEAARADRPRRDRDRGRRREDRGPRREERRAAPEAGAEGGAEAVAGEPGAAEAAPAPAGASEHREGKDGRKRGRRRDRKEREPGEDREPKAPPAEYTLEAAENCPAAIFLKEVLKRMGVEAQVLAYIEEEGIRLYIDTRAMGILIGHRGETLDALQYLTSLCVNRNRKEDGYSRVTIDAEGYREKREETLTRLARKVAGQVKATGRSRTLEPMNPYERRVLHATLQSNPYVDTRSEGEEPNRRVVIFPKK